MNFLRRLLRLGTDPPRAETVAVDLSQHDVNICDLAEALEILERVNPEPLTARVRGMYPDRRVRDIRINPRSAEHHG